MRGFQIAPVILAAQLSSAAGVQAHGETGAAPKAFRHQRSSRPGIHLISDDEYTGLAGAYVTGSGAKSVTGTFVIPNITIRSTSTEYYLTAWIGLDGGDDSGVELLVGVDLYLEGLTTTIEAWYEWYPDYA